MTVTSIYYEACTRNSDQIKLSKCLLMITPKVDNTYTVLFKYGKLSQHRL